MGLFGKSRTHKLPKFPASVIPTFKMLVEVLSSEEAAALHVDLDMFLEKFRAASKTEPIIDFVDAEELAAICHYLLEHYDDFDPHGKSLVVAAVRYVAVADDPFCDATFASGFYDDKKVVNYVLESLNIHDKYLKVTG